MSKRTQFEISNLHVQYLRRSSKFKIKSGKIHKYKYGALPCNIFISLYMHVILMTKLDVTFMNKMA